MPSKSLLLGIHADTRGCRIAQDQQAEWFAHTGFAEARSVSLRKFRRHAPDILSLA